MPARLSADLKALKGTLRPGREASRSRDLLSVPPKPPAYLSVKARAEWKRIAADAIAVGITTADIRALVLLCETLATECELRAVLEREGHTVSGANGGTKAHPALSALAQTRQQATLLLQSFGLTPRGRQALPSFKAKPARKGPFSQYA